VLKGNVPPGTALGDARKIPQTAIFAYGNFITVLINFLLLALIIFLMVKAINTLRRKHEESKAAPAAPSATEQLLMEIRDELRKRP
jgi:large conductance mechanosensitive channel